MKIDLFFVESFRMLLNFRPGKLLLLFVLTLFLGVFSGFSIVLLIPLLKVLAPSTEGQTNQITDTFNDLAEKAGIQLNLETILIIYVIVLSVVALLQLWKSLLDASYQQNFIYQIRSRLFRKIIMADWELLNNKSKTNHLQVLSKEVPNMADYFFFIMRVLAGFIMTASYMAWAMLISLKFTLFITFIGLVLFLLLRKYLFRAFHLGEGFVDSYNHLLRYIDDFWLTVKIAKVHSSENFYYKKFDMASASLLGLEYQMEKNHALPKFIYKISGILVLVLVVYIGYKFGLIPLTAFFILIILFSRIYPQFTSINTDINIIITHFASVKRVMQLDKDFPEPDIHAHQSSIPIPLTNEINIKKLNFSFSGDAALFENFNAKIPAFSLTGIIGQSGRGKTTLIDLIAGLQQPFSGEICVDGQVLDQEILPKWRKGIGYLPQDSFFIDGSLRENLVWDSHREISETEIRNVLEQVNALQLVRRFKKGLDEDIVNYQFHFSGGERQRLALARVLLRQPKILLLDEATSSLDEDNEKQIMDLLAELKTKVTILFVTHRTSVLPWCDKIIQIE
ncbi:ATP-binding cassette domain-containing protein [Algibacter mikhailovii]|uniref:ABC transporter ATP-binding protein n=1 Tax=Algibacter mikhailovii TaxID=425498 RepID=A0A918QW29_9FLAO|nr:ABC transporter ATP-binding protein [Algibacter mikhailovii]GGZ75005.1 ABC transporter ATP-binding protein [Algibacter mikhailovii]